MKAQNDTLGSRTFDIVNPVVLLITAIVCVIPMIHLLAISLSSKVAINAGSVSLFPVDFQLDAYSFIIKEVKFWTAFLIAIERTVLGVAINMLFTILAAYPLSKPNSYFKARSFYVWYILIAMLFNGGMIPTYLVVHSTGLINTIWALIIPGAVPVFSVILLQNYLKSIPNEIAESGYIDGAGHWRILFQLMLPLSMPVLAVLILFSAVGHWNSWFEGMLYINETSKYPLQTYLQTIVVQIDYSRINDLRDIENLSTENSRAAQIVLAMIPILCVYPFLQNYFTKGIVLGAVKG